MRSEFPPVKVFVWDRSVNGSAAWPEVYTIRQSTRIQPEGPDTLGPHRRSNWTPRTHPSATVSCGRQCKKNLGHPGVITDGVLLC